MQAVLQWTPVGSPVIQCTLTLTRQWARDRGVSPQDGPSLRPSYKSGPPEHPRRAMHWDSYNPLLRFSYLLEWLTESRESLYLYLKDTRYTSRWRITEGEVWKFPQCRGFTPVGVGCQVAHFPFCELLCIQLSRSSLTLCFGIDTIASCLDGASRQGLFVRFFDVPSPE